MSDDDHDSFALFLQDFQAAANETSTDSPALIFRKDGEGR
jgi:hypothetical protein